MSRRWRPPLLFFLGFYVLFLSGCSSFLYQPTSIATVNFKKLGGPVPENIFFSSRDGTPLHGWYFHHSKQGPAKGRIVFFHGNAGSVSSHFAALYWILNEGYDFFVFDYQGYGLSQGTPSPKHTIDDGVAALRWAAQQKPDLPLIVFGQSLGGAVAVVSVAEFLPEAVPSALIVDSTFHSYKAVARSLLAQYWITFLFQPLAHLSLSDEYAPKNFLKNLQGIPLLVLHGEEDRSVSAHLGHRLYKLAHEPKEMLWIPRGRHIDALWREDGKYRQLFLDYLDEVIEPDRFKNKKALP